MGDVPIAYVEGAGGVRVSEDEIVAVGKHDARIPLTNWMIIC
jgi:ribosome-binding ATPase